MIKRFTTTAVSMAFILAAAGLTHAQEVAYPEKCKAADSHMAMKHEQMMKSAGMDMQAADFQKEYMEGMNKTMPLMMGGMMKDDADVAFVCGMIAHHMGAIEMSKTELKYGDDKKAKRMAQKIIDAQVKEIRQMTKWVEANVK